MDVYFLMMIRHWAIIGRLLVLYGNNYFRKIIWELFLTIFVSFWVPWGPGNFEIRPRGLQGSISIEISKF